MTELLVFEAQWMLTNSLRQTVRILDMDDGLAADITDIKLGGADAWYELLEAVPQEIQTCGDRARIVEFLQDVLLSMGDTLRTHVVGIRVDPDGLLDFLLDRDVETPVAPPPTLDVVINGIRYQPVHAES